MAAERMYLYGVVPACGTPADFGPIGIDGRPVRAVGDGQVAMLAGPVSDAADFSHFTPQQALRCLAEHQRALERVMTDTSVIPLKFGTVARDQRQITDILRAGGQRLADTLSKYGGKVEMDVSVYWGDLQAALAATADDPAVAALKKQIASSSAPTVQQRIQLGQAVKAALDCRRQRLAEELLGDLKGRWPDLLGSPTKDESQILHAAALILREEEGQFDQALERLNAAHEGRLRFRCVGPLPPYSFATVEVESLDAEALDHARGVLELGDSASLAEVKAAYRRLVRANHPDRNAGPDAAGKVKQVTAAAELLERYATNYRHRFSAAEEGVSLVHVRSLLDLPAGRQA
jgi:DnaJ-domain-containing protein 1